MTQQEALVGLNLFSGIGSARLKKLLEVFVQPQNILTAPIDTLKKIDGIGEVLASQIPDIKISDIEREFKLANKYRIDILTVADAGYPENLKQIYDPPIVLYIKGDLSPQDKLSIAIVGSRRASFYGLSSAEKFAYELANLGLTVISGLAYGIDTQAHKGALKAFGRTIAVLGSGFGHIYPEENQELAQEISQRGAVISEFPINTEPFKQNFPRRNRVISGLSLGVLVVEAARNSGALITADFALEQGREVFALPGKVDSNTSFGTNGLIKQGAKLVSNIEDILEELNLNLVSDISLTEKEDSNKGLDVDDSFLESKEDPHINELTADESVLYNTLSKQPLHLDDIVDRTRWDVSQVLNILLALEMKRFIRQFPGKQFARRINP